MVATDFEVTRGEGGGTHSATAGDDLFAGGFEVVIDGFNRAIEGGGRPPDEYSLGVYTGAGRATNTVGVVDVGVDHRAGCTADEANGGLDTIPILSSRGVPAVDDHPVENDM